MSEQHAAPKHPYHLVDPSPWPLVGAIAAGLMATGGVLYMHGHGWTLLIIGALLVLGTMFVWWRDVVREAYAHIEFSAHRRDTFSDAPSAGSAVEFAAQGVDIRAVKR